MPDNKKTRLYLDNCCFNRPYDDQSNLLNRMETEAKLFIQEDYTEWQRNLYKDVPLNDFLNRAMEFRKQQAK